MIPTIKPTYKQHLAWEKLKDSTTMFLMFGGGAGGGKSWLGCEWLITMCYMFPKTKWFIAREELKRLMQSTFITFTKVCEFHQIPREDWRLDGKYNYIEFFNGSRIDLLDVAYMPSDPLFQRLGSLEYTGGWLEEAGETHFLAFDILKSRIGRHMNKEYQLFPKILLTTNPNKDWEYREIYKPYREGKLGPEYAFIQSLFGDNEYTAKDYEQALNSITDQATKERLKFGNWEYDDDPTVLMNYEAILDLFTNTVDDTGEKYLVVDAARYGSDRIVYSFWNGLKCYKVLIRNKQGIDITINDVCKFLQEEQIPYSHCIVDEDGVGGGIVDGLRGIKGFMANRIPFNGLDGKPEPYQNLKAQCAYLLADKVNNHKMAVEIADESVKTAFIEEMEQIKSKDTDKDGKLKLMPKDEVKERLGRSPDISDTFIMRMYFEFDIPINYSGVSSQWKPDYKKLNYGRH